MSVYVKFSALQFFMPPWLSVVFFLEIKLSKKGGGGSKDILRGGGGVTHPNVRWSGGSRLEIGRQFILKSDKTTM